MASDEKKIRKQISKQEKQFAKSPSPRLVMSLITNYKKLDEMVNAVNVAREGLMKCANSNMIKVALASILWEYEIDENDEALGLLEDVLGNKPDNLAAQKLLTTIETTRTGELRIVDIVDLKSSHSDIDVDKDSVKHEGSAEPFSEDKVDQEGFTDSLDVPENQIDGKNDQIRDETPMISEEDLIPETLKQDPSKIPEPDEPFEDFVLPGAEDEEDSVSSEEAGAPENIAESELDVEGTPSVEEESTVPDIHQDYLESKEEVPAEREEYVQDVPEDSEAVGSILEKARQCLMEKDIEQGLELYRSILEFDPENSEAQEGFRVAYAQSISSEETDDDSYSADYYDAELGVLRRQIRILDALQTAVQRIYSK